MPRSHLISVLLILTLVLVAAACDLDKDVDLSAGSKNSSSSTSTSTSSSSSGGDTSVDSDDDGLADDVESTFGLNSLVADTDHDGFDDGLEFVGTGGDPLSASLTPTSSSRARTIDASVAVRNDIDSDQDGLGDTFESNSGLDSNNPDTDGDGYTDAIELIANSNPFSSDSRPQRDTPPTTDGVTRTDQAPADNDSDGLSDSFEALDGTLSNSRDSDGDGFADGIEFLMGSDGLDVLSVPNFTVPTPPT